MWRASLLIWDNYVSNNKTDKIGFTVVILTIIIILFLLQAQVLKQKHIKNKNVERYNAKINERLVLNTEE